MVLNHGVFLRGLNLIINGDFNRGLIILSKKILSS